MLETIVYYNVSLGLYHLMGQIMQSSRNNTQSISDDDNVLAPYVNVEAEIQRLKKEQNALILAHYYQDSEVQDIADYVGDELELSIKASATNADVIVFCGNKFMAETACILNPDKKVIIPDSGASCSLVESCIADDFAKFRKEYPDHLVITHINSSSAVKALSDFIVTSDNAEDIINSMPEDKEIIFAPDMNLGRFLSKKTSREMILWQGKCAIHNSFSERELIRLKTQHPNAKIVAHPKCPANLIEYANHIGSISSIINFVKENISNDFIVLTEPGIIHQMQKISPNSKFYDVPSINQEGKIGCNECPQMRLNTLEKIYHCLRTGTPEITVDKNIAPKVKKSLDKMLQAQV